ncbi:MAG: glycosyltransferase family 39 protein [Firmicutes bacterium]|nr:glycosyltransferase family 39 protein [Bacillota bacterium]
MEKKKNNIVRIILNNWHIVVIIVFLCVFSIQFFNYITTDKSIPQSDSISHSFIAARVFHISSGTIPPDYLKTLSYPPLLYHISSLSFRLFGVSSFSLLLPMWAFCIIFLLSVYGTGSVLGGKIGGLSSFFLAFCSYYFLYTGERYFLDLPAAALCCASVYFILKSDGFRNLPFSVLFGVSLGLSQLIKWNSCFFTIPALSIAFLLLVFRDIKKSLLPVIFTVLSTLIFVFYIKLGLEFKTNPQLDKNSDLTTAFIIIMVVLALSLIFLVSIRFIASKNRKTGDSDFANLNYPLSLVLSQIIFYPLYFSNIRAFFEQFARQQNFTATQGIQFSLPANINLLLWSFPFAGILLCIGLIFSVRIYRKIPELLILLISGAAGLLLVSYGAPPDFRYFLPTVVFFCVIGGYWTGICFTGKPYRFIIPIVLAIISLLPYSSYFSGYPQLPPFRQNLAFSARGFSTFFRINLFAISKPEPNAVNFRKVLEDIIENEKKYGITKPEGSPLKIETLITKEFEQYSGEKEIPSVRSDITQYITEFHTPPGVRFITFNRRIDENTTNIDKPSYLLVFFINQDDLKKIEKSLDQHSIKTSVVSLYNLDPERSMAVLLLN